MKVLANKLLINVFFFLVQFGNLFLANIIVYEATEGIKFDWNSLLHNRMFWIWLIVLIGYNVAMACYDKEDTAKVKKAYEKSEINLLKMVEKDVKKHDFASVNETVKVIEIVKRLGKEE